ncbi:tyrosine-protein phosphatase [Flavobacterium cucumis]|uniref:protein-tyrosine-phosphatase n=2 Tax=Flavobacterium cucumis TaxID=416016 RepID=A0A1M7ZWP3_9FLAO|nr:Tyrosine-protein phosphatase YwqE [Flavobacterium cucumis]
MKNRKKTLILHKFQIMLSLFKSKPLLKDLIPTNYVDIHAHFLPGIDDGAQNLSETKQLLEAMKELGFSQCIATPHTMKNVWNNTTQSIQAAVTNVKTNLPTLSKDLQIKAASEYFLDENIILQVQEDKLLTLKDNLLLVEMSYLNAPLQLFDFLFELQLKGYQLILAHPERYTYYHESRSNFDKLKKAGCLFQLNLLATVGYYGKEVAEIANYLLNHQMYDFVGSDIHHLNHIKAFQNKIVIKNQKELMQVIEKNRFFSQSL